MSRLTEERGERPALRAGFTLIEVLVAVVILSICIVVVLSRFNTSLIALGASRDSLWTDVIVKEKLAEMEASIPGSAKTSQQPTSGRFSCPGGTYLWEVTIRREADSWTDTLNELTIKAWREGSGKERTAVSYVRTASPRLETVTGK